MIEALCDDLNTPRAIAAMHNFAREARKGDDAAAQYLTAALEFLGFDPSGMSSKAEEAEILVHADPAFAARINERIEARLAARAAKDWGEADRIRDELAGEGIVLKDYKDAETGEIKTSWEEKR